MSAENWHEERDRLVLLLASIRSGQFTNTEENELRQAGMANKDTVAMLEERLATLNARLGD